MNEQELRDGLRQVMAVSSQPPTMNPNAALDAARRAHKRRRATWAGVGAGATVVALAAGTVFALAPSGDPLPIGPAAGGPGLAPPPSAAEPGESTKTSWPDGQVDRTARNGVRADTAEAVLAALKAAVVPTLAVDEKLTYPNSDAKITSSQASFENYAGPGNKQEVWQYLVTAAVTKKSAPSGGTGRVMVLVYTPGNTYPADVCELTPKFWGGGGTCETQVVQGKTVGVVAQPKDRRVNTIVGYRYDDGTVVFVAQSKDPNNEDAIGRGKTEGAMAAPPLTIDQLAPMVLNPAFKVS